MRTPAHPTNRHYCCGKDGWCELGRFEDLRCKSKHPEVDGAICTRIPGHDGPHQGYTYSIITPSEWS